MPEKLEALVRAALQSAQAAGALPGGAVPESPMEQLTL